MMNAVADAIYVGMYVCMMMVMRHDDDIIRAYVCGGLTLPMQSTIRTRVDNKAAMDALAAAARATAIHINVASVAMWMMMMSTLVTHLR